MSNQSDFTWAIRMCNKYIEKNDISDVIKEVKQMKESSLEKRLFRLKELLIEKHPQEDFWQPTIWHWLCTIELNYILNGEKIPT